MVGAIVMPYKFWFIIAGAAVGGLIGLAIATVAGFFLLIWISFSSYEILRFIFASWFGFVILLGIAAWSTLKAFASSYAFLVRHFW
jgi:hypothetical protein